jgi:endoglucanase Acf2
MMPLPKHSEFHGSNGHNRMFKPNIVEKYARFRIFMTTGQYTLMYGSKTRTKNRWDENRISAAEIKIRKRLH